MTTKDPIATRHRIIDAAEQVAGGGADAFTLDAVAAVARISKGGVLHHFSNKDALALALIERTLDTFEQGVDASAARIGGKSAWARAFLRVSLLEAGSDVSDPRPARAFLGAAARDPRLMAPVRARYESWTARLAADVSDPVLAATIRLTADGCWWADVLELPAPDAATRAAIVGRLESVLDP